MTTRQTIAPSHPFLRPVWVFFLSVLWVSQVWSQAPDGESSEKDKALFWAMGAHMGPLLPNQIDGISEIMPMSGVYGGMSTNRGFLEIGTYAANAYGASYYSVSASYRHSVHWDDLEALAYFGVDLHYYSPPNTAFKTIPGGHVGIGMTAPVGSDIFFRSDMKFNLNPGTALYVGFGIEIRTPLGTGG